MIFVINGNSSFKQSFISHVGIWSNSQDLFGELRIIFEIYISETTEKFENCSPLKGATGTT
jgi:hypothetical protein